MLKIFLIRVTLKVKMKMLTLSGLETNQKKKRYVDTIKKETLDMVVKEMDLVLVINHLVETVLKHGKREPPGCKKKVPNVNTFTFTMCYIDYKRRMFLTKLQISSCQKYEKKSY